MSREDSGEDWVAGRYGYVGFWARTAAALIDTVILSVVILPPLYKIYGMAYWQSTALVHGFWDLILSWVLPFAAIIGFWRWRQATPGKMVIKAEIVDRATGGVPTTRQWLIRYLGYYVSSLPLGLGLLWVGWDPRKQGWHDKMAGTVVVRRIAETGEPGGDSSGE